MSEHVYAAIWTHLGPYGRQDVHLHHCIADTYESCHAVLVGEGRGPECSTHPEDHHAKRLVIAKNAWSDRENEGRPL